MQPPTPHLVYFADPMCSWCWGFAPVLDAIAGGHPDLPIRLILGGLRPFTETAMDEAAKQRTRLHWEHVAKASGQPFDFGFFERTGFVYDTEPAARAVVTARRLQPGRTFALNRRIGHAFYAENRDVTQAETLADLAEEIGFERDDFLAAFEDGATKTETLQDFAIAQQAGVTGFPTLLAGPQDDGSFLPITVGYQAPEAVLARLGMWLEHQLEDN
ncbi:DsbA family protein [Aurantimonas endophytica]|uniref:DSBA-like thioredoxin domain-containing protein n=1 Tax=Aurantimonas endophytica TaxID=1522175 RepID=A0A7W6HBW7_9HYPH|nr:DsbA family protein [Aurantimonas endophytica]MBB4002272.1 putative protein-disulfide isomerase [Aurantimonas endophytica]MCO6402104.1 DsbA family protein [Aurantimonas endophytica]